MSNGDRFDKFNERARYVLSSAQAEAQRLQHNYIGTEHLLLGLLRDETNVATTIVCNLHVDPVKVRDAIEFIISRGDRIVTGPQIGLTPRGKKVIELAVDEARRLNHHYIGTEHLLLGLIREGEGIAAGVLGSLGVRYENARTEAIRILNQEVQSPQSPSNEPPSTQPEQPTNTVSRATTEPIKPRTVVIVQTTSSKPYLGYPFTEQSHTILANAQEEALRFSHNYIGTEHLLLGMVREGEGVAGAVLQNLGVELTRVRKAVEFIIGRGDRIVLGEIGLTPRSKKILQLASEEAQRMNNSYVGTEHLLLGMVTEGEGIAAGVLNSLGVYVQNVRAETTRVLQHATREE